MAKLIKGENDLASQYPEVAAEWHPTLNGNKTSSDIAAQSNKKVWWLGADCGHEWESIVFNRTSRGTGCPYCSGRKVLSGFNDLATLNPELLAEWAYDLNDVSPTELSPGSHVRVWWRCSHDHTWEAEVKNRVHGRGCPYCSGQKTVPGSTDLASLHPDLLSEWAYDLNGISPEEVTPGSSRKVWWRCSHGHTWQTAIWNRTESGHSCPYCAGLKVDSGTNDLASQYPDIAAEWAYDLNDQLPSEVYHGSAKTAWWRCSHGHTWQAVISSRTRHLNGCPHCSMSSGEQAVAHALDGLGVRYLYDKPLADCCDIQPLRHDFILLTDGNRVIATIEFHGKQHYEPVAFCKATPDELAENHRSLVRRDAIKTRWLTAHGIPQLVIPFSAIAEVRELLTAFLNPSEESRSVVVYSPPIFTDEAA